MSTEYEAGELNPQEQMIYDGDLADLQRVAKEHGVDGLAGRVKYGLDPAGMMAVRETALLVNNVVGEEGADLKAVWPLIAKFHKEGPWSSAEQLKAKITPEIRVYLVLAAACKEAGYPGHSPREYLKDRRRVVEELGSYGADKFDERRQEIASRVEILRVEASGRVPVAKGDVALPLSVQGYEGCVSKAGEMNFAQTTEISDRLLVEAGLVKGFAEVYSSEKNDFVRVSLDSQDGVKGRVVWVQSTDAGKPLEDMKPAVKRIAPGYVLTYKDERLAIDLVDKAIGKE